MDREDLKYIEDGKLIDNDSDLKEDINVKIFNLTLINTDTPYKYQIIDEDNYVLFEMWCDSDKEALSKFKKFAQALDSTNAQVTDVYIEGA